MSRLPVHHSSPVPGSMVSKTKNPTSISIICCALFALISIQLKSAYAKGVKEVGCGSVLKLENTAYYIRLHSHDIKYGSGSGQQSVTGVESTDDVSSHWVVKGTPKLPCQRGEPVNCGSKIRLEHLQTGKNLHSHLFSSPLSGHQEVSAFGVNGEGDTGDVWEVICNGDTWKRDSSVQFKHVDTGVYLACSGNTFGRPISGQLEIVGLNYVNSACNWQTLEGVFIHKSELSPRARHDEL